MLLRIAVSFGLIGYFLYSLSFEQGGLSEALEKFARAFSSASVHWLLPAFLLHLLGFSLISLRWKILLRPQRVRAKFVQLFLYYFMAAFFNTILPSTIGGDAVRAIESRKLTGQSSTSVTVIVIERLTGMMALALIAAAALVLKITRGSGEETLTRSFVSLVLAGFFLLIVFSHPRVAPGILNFSQRILPKKIQSFLEQAYQAAAAYYQHPGAFLTALGVSLVFQLNMVVYYYCIARSVQQIPDPLDFLLKAPILIFLLMTVPAVNGIGIRTYVFTQMMKFPKALALSAEAVDLGFKYIYALLGGLVFLLYRRRSDRSQPTVDPGDPAQVNRQSFLS